MRSPTLVMDQCPCCKNALVSPTVSDYFSQFSEFIFVVIFFARMYHCAFVIFNPLLLLIFSCPIVLQFSSHIYKTKKEILRKIIMDYTYLGEQKTYIHAKAVNEHLCQTYSSSSQAWTLSTCQHFLDVTAYRTISEILFFCL